MLKGDCVTLGLFRIDFVLKISKKVVLRKSNLLPVNQLLSILLPTCTSVTSTSHQHHPAASGASCHRRKSKQQERARVGRTSESKFGQSSLAHSRSASSILTTLKSGRAAPSVTPAFLASQKPSCSPFDGWNSRSSPPGGRSLPFSGVEDHPDPPPARVDLGGC